MSEDLFEAYMDTVDQCKKTRVVTPAVQMAKASFQIRDAFAALRAAKLALYQASEKAISAKAALDKKKSELLASDTIQGKNAETEKPSSPRCAGPRWPPWRRQRQRRERPPTKPIKPA